METASLGVAAGLIYWWYMGRTAADFFILVLALTQMYPPIKELSRIGMTMQKTLAASESVFHLLERDPALTHPAHVPLHDELLRRWGKRLELAAIG